VISGIGVVSVGLLRSDSVTSSLFRFGANRKCGLSCGDVESEVPGSRYKDQHQVQKRLSEVEYVFLFHRSCTLEGRKYTCAP
jgi:hypothetical protein